MFNGFLLEQCKNSYREKNKLEEENRIKKQKLKEERLKMKAQN